MSYNKKVWKSGDRITKEALNNMENGIEAAHQNSGGTGTSYDDTEIKTDINTIKTDLGTEELTTTAKDVKGAVNEVAAQFKDIAKKTVIENSKLYLVKSDGTKLDDGTALPINSGGASNTIQTYDTNSIGELFSAPDDYGYLAWPAGNIKYDKNIDKYVCIVNCADKHVFKTLTHYICFIDSETYACSELTKITVADTTLDNSAICNFTILADGSYMIIAVINKLNCRLISKDNGITWTNTGSINYPNIHMWAIYKLSKGRLIATFDYNNFGFCISDDDGVSWTNKKPNNASSIGSYVAETCILELEENKLMAITRRNSSGNG